MISKTGPPGPVHRVHPLHYCTVIVQFRGTIVAPVPAQRFAAPLPCLSDCDKDWR